MLKTLAPLLVLFCAIQVVAQTSSPQTLGYVLQPEGMAPTRDAVVNRLAKSDRDWIILDTQFDGDPWPPQVLQTIRDGKPGRKVLAYISIGEAEDYREYWEKKWDANKDGKPDDGAPGFLCEVNPDWEGNYKVRYWHRDWQAMILKRIATIMQTQKFDGLYLDIIDAFSFFEHDPKTDKWLDHRRNEQTGNTYRIDMIRWVQIIARHARRFNPDALIIPQNGEQLLEDKAYSELVSGIGIEDLFSDGNKKQSEDDTAYRLSFIKPFIATGKPVWLVNYATHPRYRRLAKSKAKELGMRLLITDRQLKTLGISRALQD
ncbi:MAG: endo alpha-1,4 polygalactosaminidase [Phycisphaeraceae bacterium JB051]